MRAAPTPDSGILVSAEDSGTYESPSPVVLVDAREAVASIESTQAAWVRGMPVW